MGQSTSLLDPHFDLWRHCLDFAAVSDIGLRRANNQDAIAVALAGSQEAYLARGHLFMVADGMGGRAGGELASRLATDVVPLAYQKLLDRSPPEALKAAVEDANRQINTRGTASEDFKGMGTTGTALLLLPQGAVVAHVGDSRAYRLRGRRFEQLTADHTWVWELRRSDKTRQASNFVPKNIITRVIGGNPEVQVDLEGPFPVQPGDTFLLCSDGLSGQVKDEEIGGILSCLPPQEAAQALVGLANFRGGPDNISVVVVRVSGPLVAQGAAAAPAAPHPSRPRRPVHPAVWSVLGIAALTAGILAAMELWIPALASLATAVGAAIAAAVQHFGGQSLDAFAHDRLGEGPYLAYDCHADAAFVARLAQVVQEVRDAASASGFQIDWPAFNGYESRGGAAGQAGNHFEAVRQYCEAIGFMVEQLRKQHKGPEPDESVVP